MVVVDKGEEELWVVVGEVVDDWRGVVGGLMVDGSLLLLLLLLGIICCC